jgi:hypothetical protein
MQLGVWLQALQEWENLKARFWQCRHSIQCQLWVMLTKLIINCWRWQPGPSPSTWWGEVSTSMYGHFPLWSKFRYYSFYKYIPPITVDEAISTVYGSCTAQLLCRHWVCAYTISLFVLTNSLYCIFVYSTSTSILSPSIACHLAMTRRLDWADTSSWPPTVPQFPVV